MPNSEVQDIMRLIMDDCNWEEFVNSGHTNSLNLIPWWHDVIDIAMYNILEDPSEKKDLRFELPEIFAKLRFRAIFHLNNVVPEDFPPQDFSGHPSNFQGYFSPGWSEPEYS